MGLSSHVLDTTLGKPAPGIELLLEVQQDAKWEHVGRGETDADGRCRTLLGKQELQAAMYRLRFFTEAYYAKQNAIGLYPYVDIVFQVRDPQAHYHIPLLLTANGYTTYRGS